MTGSINVKLTFLILAMVLTLACGRGDSAINNSVIVANNQLIERLNSTTEAFVASDYSDLRSAGNTEGRILQTIRKSTPVQIISKSSNWYLVKTKSGSEGWMHKSTLKFNNSNIQSKPSPNYEESQPKPPPITFKTPESTSLPLGGTE